MKQSILSNYTKGHMTVTQLNLLKTNIARFFHDFQ